MKTNQLCRRGCHVAQLITLALTLGCQKQLPVVDETADGSVAPAVNRSPADTVVARARAQISAYGSGQFRGTAEFSQDAEGSVTAGFAVQGCAGTEKVIVSIREGMGCTSDAEIGKAWSRHPASSASCRSGSAFTALFSLAKPPKPADWSIGGSTETDLAGRAVVVVLEGKPGFVGCGVIARRTPEER